MRAADHYIVFMDQIDAEIAASAWIEALAQKARPTTPFVELRRSGHETDGRTITLWVHHRITAIAVIERDDFNRSVLVCCDLSESISDRMNKLEQN